MISLKRCKLCNSAATMLSVSQAWRLDGESVWWARCVDRENCKADSYHSFATEEQAADYWNQVNTIENNNDGDGK